MIENILKDKFEKYYDFLNKKMIEEQLIKRGIKDKKLIETLYEIKRHFFIPLSLKTRSYDDCAIEISPGQTISQPYITALMIELLELSGNEKVLEIGTGTAWQTAILARMAKEIYSVEIRETLNNFALENIKKFNFQNIKMKIDDGKKGWIEESPFDRIIINCATQKVPDTLFDQLSDKGILLAPIGNDECQILKIYNKNGNNIQERQSIPVRFVKMI